jgi:hypothetical protein
MKPEKLKEKINMIKKFLLSCLMFISCICFANERPSNEIQRMFEKVPFFEFKRHYFNNITVSYVMIEKHIYIFVRDENRQTGGLIHSVKCPQCTQNND